MPPLKSTGQATVTLPVSKNAPEPWVVVDMFCGYVKIDAQRRAIAYVYGNTKAEREANARLMAAAPDLLEALKAICNMLELIGLLGETIAQAETAIQKAEGRSLKCHVNAHI